MATATTTSARSCSTWEAKNRFARRPVCAVHVVACTVHTQLCTERYKARSLGEGGTGAREAGQGRNKWSTIHSSDTGCSAQICVSHFTPTLNFEPEPFFFGKMIGPRSGLRKEGRRKSTKSTES